VNIALRAVHEELGAHGDAAVRWHALVVALSHRAGDEGVVRVAELKSVLGATGVGGTTGEWMANLRLLRVVDPGGRLDPVRAEAVGTALELAADSFDPLGTAPFWAPVATLPLQLRELLHPPPLRQTAGVLLELIDASREEVRLAAPFVDPLAVGFVAGSLVAAGRRGVDVTVVTSIEQGSRFSAMAAGWGVDPRAGLRIVEVQTDLSPLGSHAKVLVVDGKRGYVGSANLTAAGLGRHIEIGVELAGPQVAELTKILVALERVGTLVLSAG
jgi:phosphatidylserine/phosphatidylglycerophosphate/cardiolipin synthase-like enzyme